MFKIVNDFFPNFDLHVWTTGIEKINKLLLRGRGYLWHFLFQIFVYKILSLKIIKAICIQVLTAVTVKHSLLGCETLKSDRSSVSVSA
jgi:hypothetical protein